MRWIMRTFSWQWCQYQHQLSLRRPASCDHPTYAATYIIMKPPTAQRGAILMLECRAFEGVTSEYMRMVLVLQWCVVYGLECILRNVCENLGCGLVWVRCMRVRVLPIPPASVPLFNLQIRWSEILRELMMRTVISIGHYTILRRFVKWVLQTYQVIWDLLIKEAIIWNTLSYVCKNRYRVIFHLRRSGLFPIRI